MDGDISFVFFSRRFCDDLGPLHLAVIADRVFSLILNKFKKQGTGFGAGLTTGFSIGLLWAPCAGPSEDP